MMAYQTLLLLGKREGFVFIFIIVCISAELHPDDFMFPHKPPTVFDSLRRPDLSLIEQIIMIEQRVCQNTCGPDFPSQSRNTENSLHCQVCQCDATCVHYHTCCPDVVLRKTVTYDGLGSECVQLVPTVIAESFYMTPSEGLFSSIITKCYAGNSGVIPGDIPLEEQANEVTQRFKCERADINYPDEALPVTDITTNLTYRNVHCARCNHVQEDAHFAWKANISCEENADRLMQSAPSKMELFRLLLSTEDVMRLACRMIFMPKDREYGRECRLPMRRIISTCNETGYWDAAFYDADIEKACLMYTSLFDNRYKNMFCFLCNYYPMSLDELMEWVSKPGGNPARITFSALVDFSSDDNKEYIHDPSSDCSANQIFDNSSCSCRDVRCSEWEKFDEENKVCRRRIESESFGYHACFKVTVELLDVPDFSSISDLVTLASDLEASYRFILTISSWCPGNKTIIMYLEIWKIETDVAPYGHSFEKAFDNDGKIFCEFVQEWSKNGTESCTLDAVDHCPSYARFTLPCESREVIPLEQVVLTSYMESFDDENEERQEFTFLPYSKLEYCASVDISVAEFNDSQDVLVHHVSTKNVSKSKVAFVQNNTRIRMCLSDYLQWAHVDTSPCLKSVLEYKYYSDTSFDHWTPAGLISIITTCISLFFLFLTFVTYLLFEKLRTQGSKNIMVLTATLFIAQVLYEFGIEQFENKLLCSIFGIMIHYFWLASIFSMNACTVERFVKLCYPLESRSFFMTKKPFVIATSYTFVCPLVIIGCNVIVNVVMNNHVGYGNSRYCYINERYSGYFTFVLPMCLIVILNTVLLILTIVKLRRRQSLTGDSAKASRSRIGLVACVRLTVVTGITWLLSLFYEALPYDAMGYVLTALLGLQGVIFFFSLLGNKTVLGYYVQRFRTEPPRRTETPRTQSTSGTASSKGDSYQNGKSNIKY